MSGIETGQSQRGQKSDQGIFTMPGKESEPGAGYSVRSALSKAELCSGIWSEP